MLESRVVVKTSKALICDRRHLQPPITCMFPKNRDPEVASSTQNTPPLKRRLFAEWLASHPAPNNWILRNTASHKQTCHPRIHSRWTSYLSGYSASKHVQISLHNSTQLHTWFHMQALRTTQLNPPFFPQHAIGVPMTYSKQAASSKRTAQMGLTDPPALRPGFIRPLRHQDVCVLYWTRSSENYNGRNYFT